MIYQDSTSTEFNGFTNKAKVTNQDEFTNDRIPGTNSPVAGEKIFTTFTSEEFCKRSAKVRNLKAKRINKMCRFVRASCASFQELKMRISGNFG